jgi:hypothetical protein
MSQGSGGRKVAAFRLNMVFSGVDLDDDDVFERLAEFPDVVWRAQGNLAFAIATIDAPSALQAAELVERRVATAVPAAHPIRLEDDLVAIPDIASRVGVTREAVRNWANGTRHANFPLPRGVVGDGIKIWAWSDVNRWLRENLHSGEAVEFPTAHDAALINARFASAVARQSAATVPTQSWSVTRTVTTSTQARSSDRKPRRPSWSAHDRVRIRPEALGGLAYVAA